MSRKPKMHRTRIDADAYEVVAAIVAEHDDIKGTQAAVRHALLLYPQVASLKAQLVLSEQRGDDWKERAEKANPQVEKLKQVEALREEEAAVLKGEREENETLKTRLHEAEQALAATRVARDDAQRSSGLKAQTIARLEADLTAHGEAADVAEGDLRRERDEQRDRVLALEKESAGKAVLCWLWGVCIGAALVFGATWLWG